MVLFKKFIFNLNCFQNDFTRVDKEKKESVQKIQTMHQEIRDLKSKIEDFESNKAIEIKKLEDSLTETLKSNKKTLETLDQEKSAVSEVENSKKKLNDDMANLRKEKAKIESEHKNLQTVLDKKKQGEKELENMIKDLKDKLDKYENEKKSVVKLEKAKRDAVTSKHEQDKKELEEKLEKLSQKVILQFNLENFHYQLTDFKIQPWWLRG